VSSLRLILRSHFSPDPYHKYLTIRRRQRRTRKGERSRSVWENHDTLDVRRQVSLWHSTHLQVIDLCRQGRQRPDDAAPRVGTRAPGSGFIIDIRRILLKIGSLCRELHPHCQDRSGYPSRDIHPLALGWGIKFIFIGIVTEPPQK
jgi:hypothetical protein